MTTNEIVITVGKDKVVEITSFWSLESKVVKWTVQRGSGGDPSRLG